MSANPQTSATAIRPPPARTLSSSSSAPLAQAAATSEAPAASDSTLIHLTPRTPSTQASEAQQPPAAEEGRRCWICFSADEEEDGSSAEWRAPCRCSLVAHEACLLDWIADVQKTGRQNGTSQVPACPQCKTPIRLKENQSLLLDVVDSAGRIAGRLGAFVAFGGIGSVLFVGCTVYGVNTIYTVCGPEYANEILLGGNSEFQWTWRLGVGLPLIPFVLIASRTRIFDSVLPVLPVIFFCHTDPLHFTLPPSPQITLALLPYIRSFYNTVWHHCVACHEARWIKETTPRFALESAEEQQRQRQQQQQQRQANANGAQQVGADVLEQNEWDVEVVLENNNLILQGSNVTSMILGALLWPSVAKIIGRSLTWLPAAWGVRRWLPTQLARNVAGGLMVVVLKDFISLYCKYKRAQRFRSRSVVDYHDLSAAARGRRNRTGGSSRT